MICKSCMKKDVCKHYIYLKEYDGLDLKDCKYKLYSSNTNSYVSNKDYTLLRPTSREDISTKIQKINDSILNKEKKSTDFKTVSEPTKLINCPSCGTSIYPEDLKKCNICNKEICPSCGIQSFDCNKETFINMCDNCWNEKENDNIISFKNDKEKE